MTSVITTIQNSTHSASKRNRRPVTTRLPTALEMTRHRNRHPCRDARQTRAEALLRHPRESDKRKNAGADCDPQQYTHCLSPVPGSPDRPILVALWMPNSGGGQPAGRRAMIVGQSQFNDPQVAARQPQTVRGTTHPRDQRSLTLYSLSSVSPRTCAIRSEGCGGCTSRCRDASRCTGSPRPARGHASCLKEQTLARGRGEPRGLALIDASWRSRSPELASSSSTEDRAMYGPLERTLECQSEDHCHHGHDSKQHESEAGDDE